MSEPEPRWWDHELELEAELKGLLEEPLRRLAAAHERGRFPQSLLLVGPQGLGREWLAAETAAMLCCPDGGGDCRCSSCQRVRQGLHPDVELLLPQGAGRQIKIDPVRAVVKAVAGRPYEAPRRVWIFDGVERSSFGAEAANAFLKTLEEPPEHAAFLLLAANPGAVLSTILSRCQKLVLPGSLAIARGLEVAPGLQELAALQRRGLEVQKELESCQQSLRELAGGRPRSVLEWAYRLADEPGLFQLAAGAAMHLALDPQNEEQAARLTELAAELLRAEERCRVLNLNRRRQLLACVFNALAG